MTPAIRKAWQDAHPLVVRLKDLALGDWEEVRARGTAIVRYRRPLACGRDPDLMCIRVHNDMVDWYIRAPFGNVIGGFVDCSPSDREIEVQKAKAHMDEMWAAWQGSGLLVELPPIQGADDVLVALLKAYTIDHLNDGVENE